MLKYFFVYRAEHAFNPNDKEFISRRYTPKILTNSSTASPEDIESKIKRLSQTLGDKVQVIFGNSG